MDSDDDVRRFWCERLGWNFYTPDGRITDADDPNACVMSDADLAEQVRVKCWEIIPGEGSKLWRSVMDSWGYREPVQNMRAVKEVVDGQ